jgi:hypothetical protein
MDTLISRNDCFRAPEAAHGHIGRRVTGGLICFLLIALFHAPSAQAASPLSSGCMSLNNWTGPKVVPPDDSTVTLVSDTFNVNEVMTFKITGMSDNATVAFSGIGAANEIISNSFDISNAPSFTLTVTGAGRQTVAVANGDSRNRTINITASCALSTTKKSGQQGPKLTGSGAVGSLVNQGYSVAVSADGGTVAMGGPGDNNNTGALWVFTQGGGVWTQQGSKLLGSGPVGDSSLGASVALSADGNTAIVGGQTDSGDIGAAWVFTRSGGVWSQQGPKLIGAGYIDDYPLQGSSVSLSADGNTAIVGGPGDNGGIGAAWVFTRSGGVWTQQGAKLVGTGAVGPFSGQGKSVSLSADGNTAVMGGPTDNRNSRTGTAIGATWVFTRSGGVWTQQGSKLVGSVPDGTPCPRVEVSRCPPVETPSS